MAETPLNQYTKQLCTGIGLEAEHQAQVEKCRWSQAREQASSTGKRLELTAIFTKVQCTTWTTDSQRIMCGRIIWKVC